MYTIIIQGPGINISIEASTVDDIEIAAGTIAGIRAKLNQPRPISRDEQITTKAYEQLGVTTVTQPQREPGSFIPTGKRNRQNGKNI